MSDFADVVLSVWPDVVWLLAALCALLAGIGCLAAARRIAGGNARRRQARRERDLPALARAIGNAERRTRAMALGDLVISPEGERMLQARSAALTPDALTEAWCGFCDNLAEVGDPASCGCLGACGRAWCPRGRSPVPVTWTEREEGVR